MHSLGAALRGFGLLCVPGAPADGLNGEGSVADRSWRVQFPKVTRYRANPKKNNTNPLTPIWQTFSKIYLIIFSNHFDMDNPINNQMPCKRMQIV